MDDMRVVRGRTYRRIKEKRRKKRLRMLAIVLAAVVVVLLIVLLTRRSSDAEPEPAGNDAEYTAADVSQRQLAGATVTKLSMRVGELYMLTLPDGVDIRDVHFRSDNSDIVRVDDAGRVDALRAGTAKVTAVAEMFSAVCECTVTPAPTESSEPDTMLTTAYTANTDVVERNAATIEIGQYLYSLTVNRRTNTVTVYTYDENGKYTVPVRAMVCSCGRNDGHETPVGEYEVYFRDEWLGLNGDVYGYYITGFFDDFLFHSVPYRTLSHADLKAEEFNRLGENASDGCVRLMISDVLWIYEHCDVGTSVRVIDADASADPLGKPPAVRIAESATWDPTDPDPANPYKGGSPAVIGADDATVARNESFDPMKGVTATDFCGNDITDRMVIAGVVIDDKPGTYYLTYSVTDDFHQTYKLTRKVVRE